MKKNVCLTQYSVTYKVIGKNSKPNHTIKKVDFKLREILCLGAITASCYLLLLYSQTFIK